MTATTRDGNLYGPVEGTPIPPGSGAVREPARLSTGVTSCGRAIATVDADASRRRRSGPAVAADQMRRSRRRPTAAFPLQHRVPSIPVMSAGPSVAVASYDPRSGSTWVRMVTCTGNRISCPCRATKSWTTCSWGRSDRSERRSGDPARRSRQRTCSNAVERIRSTCQILDRDRRLAKSSCAQATASRTAAVGPTTSECSNTA